IPSVKRRRVVRLAPGRSERRSAGPAARGVAPPVGAQVAHLTAIYTALRFFTPCWNVTRRLAFGAAGPPAASLARRLGRRPRREKRSSRRSCRRSAWATLRHVPQTVAEPRLRGQAPSSEDRLLTHGSGVVAAHAGQLTLQRTLLLQRHQRQLSRQFCPQSVIVEILRRQLDELHAVNCEQPCFYRVILQALAELRVRGDEAVSLLKVLLALEFEGHLGAAIPAVQLQPHVGRRHQPLGAGVVLEIIVL